MIPNLKLVLHRESKAEAIYKAHTVVKAEEKKEKVDKDKDIILYLNKNITVKDYAIEKYWDCGAKIDLNFAIDLTISNGNYKTILNILI